MAKTTKEKWTRNGLLVCFQLFVVLFLVFILNPSLALTTAKPTADNKITAAAESVNPHFSLTTVKSSSLIVVPVLILLAVSFFLIKLLKRQIKQKTADLENSRQEYFRLFHQFKALLNAISDPVALFSQEHEIIWSNDSYEREMQALRSENLSVEGSFFNPRFSRNDQFIMECFNSGKTTESKLKTPDKRFWEIKGYPLKDEAETSTQVLAIATDVTEKYQLHAEAARTSRLASLGELSAGIAHEINNPNAIIMLNAPILSQVIADATELFAEHYAKHGDFSLGALDYATLQSELPLLTRRIVDSSQRIKRIVDDLKKFVALEEKKFRDPLDLNQVIKASLRLLNNVLKKNDVLVKTEYAQHLPAISGNFQQMEQVIVNLLQNACEALKGPEQTIIIRTNKETTSEMVKIQIQDSGPGIPAEILDKLADPFFTTKRSTGHAGLGLSVSSRILHDHGGRLQIESTLGEGTTITLSLPKMTNSKDDR